MVLVLDDFASKLLLPSWYYDFFLLERTLVGRVNLAGQIIYITSWLHLQLIVHVTNWQKTLYFLREIWNLKQIKNLANRKCCSICLFKHCFSFLSKKYYYVVICHSDGTYNHPKYFTKNERLRRKRKHILLVFNDVASKLLLPTWCYGFFATKNLGRMT